MGWRSRSIDCFGSVLFRGRIPPRAKEFVPALTAARVRGKAGDAGGDHRWVLDLAHPTWGSAKVVCLRQADPPPSLLIDLDPNLDQAERATAKECGSTVSVILSGAKRGDVLRDRKTLLRWMRLLMGDDGLAALDHTAQRFWSRAALDDELAHDADLDVEALFTTHVVTEGDGGPAGAEPDGSDGEAAEPSPIWMHTHGLAEVGFFDFDVLRPHRSLISQGGFDALRVMAFSILEESVKPGTERFGLAGGPGGGDVRVVDVATFNRRASRQDVALRDADAGHNRDRVVLCEPPGRWLGKFFDRPKPCAWLQRETGDGDLLVYFSTAATQLSAERARATWARFREWAAELAEFDCPVIVKIGYPTDSPGGGHEHLWFSVNAARDGSVDATLQSAPFDIARMRAGDRGEHSLEHVTDWAIITPFGMLTPRRTVPVRRVRENRDLIRQLLKDR